MTDTTQPRPKRSKIRLIRYTLRTLFVLTTITAVWMSFHVRAARQRIAVAELSKLQVIMHYKHEADWRQLEIQSDFWTTAFQLKGQATPRTPEWLRPLTGDDYFQTADAVCFPTIDTGLIRTALPHLKQLPNLNRIVLSSGSCHDQSASYLEAKCFLERELPDAQIIGHGTGILNQDSKIVFGR